MKFKPLSMRIKHDSTTNYYKKIELFVDSDNSYYKKSKVESITPLELGRVRVSYVKNDKGLHFSVTCNIEDDYNIYQKLLKDSAENYIEKMLISVENLKYKEVKNLNLVTK